MLKLRNRLLVAPCQLRFVRPVLLSRSLSPTTRGLQQCLNRTGPSWLLYFFVKVFKLSLTIGCWIWIGSASSYLTKESQFVEGVKIFYWDRSGPGPNTKLGEWGPATWSISKWWLSYLLTCQGGRIVSSVARCQRTRYTWYVKDWLPAKSQWACFYTHDPLKLCRPFCH